MSRKIRNRCRRFVAFALSMAMVISNLGANAGTVFAAGKKKEPEIALFSLDGQEMLEAIRDLDGQEAFDRDDLEDLELETDEKSVEKSYEKLLVPATGEVYALSLAVDDQLAPEDTSLLTFYRTATEDVVFLFVNESSEAYSFCVNIDGYETKLVTVNPYGASASGENVIEGTEGAKEASIFINGSGGPSGGGSGASGGSGSSGGSTVVIDDSSSDDHEDGEAADNGESDQSLSKDAAGDESDAAGKVTDDKEDVSDRSDTASDNDDSDLVGADEDDSNDSSFDDDNEATDIGLSYHSTAFVAVALDDIQDDEIVAEEVEEETTEGTEKTEGEESEESTAEETTEENEGETAEETTEGTEGETAEETTEGTEGETTETKEETVSSGETEEGSVPDDSSDGENDPSDNNDQTVLDDEWEIPGTAYAGVTIWQTARARAYVVDLEEIEKVVEYSAGLDADEVPEEVKAFLDAVKALEEAIKAENVEEALACMDACEAAFDALSEEDMEREDVIEAIAKLAELMGQAAMLAETGEGVGVTSYEGLAQAVADAGNTPTTIIIAGSFGLEDDLHIMAGQDITLTARDSAVLGRSSAAKGSIWVDSSGTLTLEDIVLDGNDIKAPYAMVYIDKDGNVTMGEGAIIQNANNDYTAKTYGGGVCNNGTFMMNGGAISDNTADSHGGGVSNAGTFIMTGGAISGNEATKWYGGGIYNSGTFTMSGGEISGNEATNASYGYGGGVYNIGTFKTTGGTIFENTAKKEGGGVYSTVGIDMSDTEISDNTNGGVKVYADSEDVVDVDSGKVKEYSLIDLVITGNTGNSSALYVRSKAKWKIQGCEITKNTSTTSTNMDNGVVLVWVGPPSNYETDNLIKDCTISENTSKGYGVLNVKCSSNGKLEIKDCSITDNDGNKSGGIYCGDGNGDITIGEGTRIERNTGDTVGGIHINLASTGVGSVKIQGAVITGNTGRKVQDKKTPVGGVYCMGKTFVFESGAIYNNEGCDFFAFGGGKAYSLIPANAMIDPEKKDDDFFSRMKYSWAGSPNSNEDDKVKYEGTSGEINLTAKSNLKRYFAQIDGQKYETLQKALEALEEVKDGGTPLIEVIYGKDGYGYEYEISEPFHINRSVSIKFDGQIITKKDGGDLFTIAEGETLTLEGNAMMAGKIKVDGNNLTMNGGIKPFGRSTGIIETKDFVIDVKDGIFTINGEVAYNGYNMLKVKLAEGQHITAGDDFSVAGGIWITLEQETVAKSINEDSNAKDPDVLLIEGCSSEDVAKDVASKITLFEMTNLLMRPEANGKNIVLIDKTAANAVYVDSKSGSDKNSGMSLEEAVQTFDRAKDLLNGNDGNTIYVVNNGLTMRGGMLDGELDNGEKIVLQRYPEYKGYLVDASNLTVTNITLDGSSDEFGVNDGKSLISASSGTVTLGKGAVLRNNDVSNTKTEIGKPPIETYGGGVYVSGGATLKMEEDAEIKNCKAANGGGVLANGKFIMNGGEIIANKAVKSPHEQGGYGGGVAIITNSGKMTMDGGSIAGNSAEISGGGIALPIDYGTQKGAELIVSSGTIENNKAANTGGGIFVQNTNTATIGSKGKSDKKVLITRNTADSNPPNGRVSHFSGGGIYVNGGKSSTNGRVQLYRVIIKENNAENGDCGGLASCPTSGTYIYLTEGGALYDNGGADLVTDPRGEPGMDSMGSTPDIYISPIMLGGCAYNWKYTADGTSVPLDKLIGKRYISYKSNPSTPNPDDPDDHTIDARSIAESEANVFITGNTGAKQGGGIGSNGDVIIGVEPKPDPPETSISLKKMWTGEGWIDEDSRPEYVEVILERQTEGKEPETYGVLRIYREEGWKKTFDELPAEDREGNKYIYSVEEVLVDGYKADYKYNYEQDAKGDWITDCIITNTPVVPKMVEKRWKGDEDRDKLRPDHVDVELWADGKKVEEVTLKASDEASDDWKHTWKDLPAYNNEGKAITYTVKEIEVSDYTSSISYEGDKVVITNTYTPPETPPETPDNPGGTPPRRPRRPRTDIPDEGTPLSDEGVPLAGLPDQPEEAIIDESVPLFGLAKTGDSRHMGLWIALFGMSGIGIFLTMAKRKKSESDGEE